MLSEFSMIRILKINYYVSHVSFNFDKIFIKWQVSIFITITFIFYVIIITKIIYSFRLLIIFLFFLLFKKCPDVSTYSALIYSVIIILFLSFFFFFFVSKFVQISLIISSFNLSPIIFGLLLIKPIPYNWS